VQVEEQTNAAAAGNSMPPLEIPETNAAAAEGSMPPLETP